MKNWHKRRFDCKFIFIVSRSQFALETWSRYKPQRSLKIFWMMTSAHALPAAPNCWRVANCCACSWWLGRATVLKKTCLKLHSLLIFPPYLCVCVCRYLKFDIASIVQFMANLFLSEKNRRRSMQLSVCLAQGPENLWQFKLLKWIFICIHHHVFTFMAGPAASVSCPKMEQRCQQCWLLDAHFEGRRTKRRSKLINIW